MNRRDLLSRVATALVMPSVPCLARSDKPSEPPVHEEEPKVVAEIAAKLEKAGTKMGAGSTTYHYRVFNDLGQKHEKFIGGVCETLLSTQLNTFGRAGLLLQRPRHRMNVVVLDRDVFVELARLEEVNTSASGFYSTSNRACFLIREHRMNLSTMPVDWESTINNLCHEATHQICYNSGLLNPLGDVPACICEGFAVVGEADRPNDVPKMLRQANRRHLDRLLEAEYRELIPLDEFFVNDDHLWGDGTIFDNDHWGDAYSWAWLLVFTLLTQDDLRPRFSAYLSAITKRKDKSHRLSDARAHFGNLSALQARLLRRLRWLHANPPSRYKSFRRPGHDS